MSNSLLDFDTKEASEKGRDMPIRKPDGSGFFVHDDGKPWTITFAGLDSRRHRKAIKDVRTAALEKAQSKELADEDVPHFVSLHLAAKLALGWSGIALGEGEIPFSEDKALEVFDRFPWLLAQAEDFITNRGNFISESPKRSGGGSNGKSTSAKSTVPASPAAPILKASSARQKSGTQS